jgi:tetratricopeptide (TPR) repeat protein
LNGKLLLALQTYSDLLKRYPNSYPGLKAAGRLSAALLHYADAAAYLERALSRNTSDGETAYYLGIAYDGLTLPTKARDAFEIAYRQPEWRAAAAISLAELSAREKNLNQAELYLKNALQAVSSDMRAAEELSAVERTLGREQARVLAQRWLEQFPLSNFLRNEVGNADLQHLANDDSRILNIAREYMRLGLYKSALEVLSRQYPGPVRDESEPAATSAARDPMFAYYRAYCHTRMGESGTADDHLAVSFSTDYIFPSSAEDLIVLRAAVHVNSSDANAHYLLGNLYFSRGLTDEALAEWSEARKLNPKIPVLDASLGLALLHAKNDPEAGLGAFRDGIHNDQRNEAVYLGADQALSILKKAGKDRVDSLELYPDLAEMPSELVFELALNLAEMGDFERADALFHNRFFPREEGGTNVRQVWLEVQLLHAMNQAENKHCEAAITIANSMASAVQGLAFTNDGLQPFLERARPNYLLGEVYSQCGRSEEARKHFENAAAKSDTGNIIWSWFAAWRLPAFDPEQWTARLTAELDKAKASENSGSAGLSVYNTAMLERALGHEREADQGFRRVFLLPDHLLSYHLAREAMAKQ